MKQGFKLVKNLPQDQCFNNGCMVSNEKFEKLRGTIYYEDSEPIFNLLELKGNTTFMDFYNRYHFNFELVKQYTIQELIDNDIRISICNENEFNFLNEKFNLNYAYGSYPYTYPICFNVKLKSITNHIHHHTINIKNVYFDSNKSTIPNKYEKMIAFKGFKFNTNNTVSCRNEIFEVGITYEKPHINNPKLCSNDGYHYCRNIKDINEFYSLTDEDNVFGLIEILGPYTEDKTKGITTKFRIIKLFSKYEIDNLLLIQEFINDQIKNYDIYKTYRDNKEKSIIEKKNKKELKLKNKFNLELIKKLQTKYPQLIIGGSIGLYIHGIVLKRFHNNETPNDIDFITPYYTLIENEPNVINVDKDKTKYKSGCDFDECLTINFIKTDIRIDPHQKYKMIEFDGFKYKVSLLEDIWAAKIRYGTEKHLNDLYEAMGVSL